MGALGDARNNYDPHNNTNQDQNHPVVGEAAVAAAAAAGAIVGEDVWGRGRDGIIPGMGPRLAGQIGAAMAGCFLHFVHIQNRA